MSRRQYPRRTVAEPSTPSRGGGLADALRRYVDAVVGVTEISRERAEKIVRELAERGETRTKDLQKAARELADRSARNQRDLARLIQKEVKRQIEALGLASRDDVKRTRTEPPKTAVKKKPAARKKAAAKSAKPKAARQPRSAPSE